MFNIFTQNLNLARDVEVGVLVDRTEGYSGSDLREIFQGAHMRAVRELFDKKELTKPQARPITMDDFREIIRKRKPSVSSQMLGLYDKWFETYKAL